MTDRVKTRFYLFRVSQGTELEKTVHYPYRLKTTERDSLTNRSSSKVSLKIIVIEVFL